MPKITFIDVPTKDLNNIVWWLKNNNWEVKYKYDGVDAGIDFDLIIFGQGKYEIRIGWTNYEEGEVQCDLDYADMITLINNKTYKIGKPSSLKEAIVSMYYKSI
jgi:hypothetical protein